MIPILAFLQSAQTTHDFTWNYVILGVLVVLAVVLGMGVMKKKQKDY
jgi:purine-cytosine permease-like protein